MKTKTVVAIMVTMLLVGMTFYAIPVKAVNYLKIGVIGPVGWIQGQGMFEGATLAANWINGPGGGIVIGGTRYDVSLHFGDEHAADMRPDLGALEMERLITVEGVDLAMGGFRTECTIPIRDKAMDYQKIFYICGAATNELIDCGATAPSCPYGCVRHNYARYKYTFRNTPVNNTMLVRNIVGFLRYYALPSRLAPLYGSPVRTAVIAENLTWADTLFNMFVFGGYLGPQANIVYSARTPWDAMSFAVQLDAMHAREVRLIVHLFSGPSSIAFIRQWAANPIKAIPVGIDEIGQLTEFWSLTGGGRDGFPNPSDVYATGGCQYETLLATSGTRSPISTVSQPYTTVQVWDQFFATFGHAPIYTSWGVYDTIIAIHDMLEAQTAIKPPFDLADANALVPIIEATNRNGVLGKFKYTQYHDPYSIEFLSTWPLGYVRPLVVQWQAGRLEVVWPSKTSWSKIWALPDETGKMYPYPSDVNQDGQIGNEDRLIMRAAIGTRPKNPNVPADPMWQFVADVVPDRVIDLFDALAVRARYGWSVELPLPYCNEAGRLH